MALTSKYDCGRRIDSSAAGHMLNMSKKKGRGGEERERGKRIVEMHKSRCLNLKLTNF